MLIEIKDQSNRVVALHDMTGTLWIAAHNGFVNRDALVVKVKCTAEPPYIVKMSDLTGRVLNYGAVNMAAVIEGYTIVFRPGEMRWTMMEWEKVQ